MNGHEIMRNFGDLNLNNALEAVIKAGDLIRIVIDVVVNGFIFIIFGIQGCQQRLGGRIGKAAFIMKAR